MKQSLTISTILIVLSVFLYQCKEDVPPPPVNQDTSTWEVVQGQIFQTNCVSCHTAGNSFAVQSDLVLTADEAYEQLIDRAPKNDAARNDGLLLLGTKGLESLYTSYLWEKINAKDQEHFYEDHTEYGEMMPLSAPFLTNGELAFIREWILAGAPETGVVADVALLEDTSRISRVTTGFKELEPPASGFQMHLGPFEVIPNYEREFFYYEPSGRNEDVFVSRIEISMRPGTHHFIMYDFLPGAQRPPENEYRDLRDQWGGYILSTVFTLEDQIFFYGTQWRQTDYRFPEGVALRLKAGHGLDMNSHYVNRSGDTVIGEVYTNVHTIPQNEVQHVAENIFLSNENFELPPNKVTTISKTWKFNERRHVFLLSSHAHEKLTEFRIFVVGGQRDGELVYYTNDWEHPPLLELDPVLTLEKDQGLRAEATYNNNTGETLKFGLLSQDEMMIIFGAYYTD